MKKSDMVEYIALQHKDVTAEEAAKIFDLTLSKIAESLSTGARVELRGFGAFTTRKREARLARNPRTNETVQLKERLAVYFRAGKKLLARINAS